ncbi:MAG: ATP-binding cassette domain-containing protein [Acidimicrobiales bacterium]
MPRSSVPGPRPSGTIMAFLWSSARELAGHRRAGGIVIVGIVAEMAFAALVPLSLRHLIDRGLSGGDRSALPQVVALLAGAGVVVSGAVVVRDFLYARMTSATSAAARTRMFTRLQHLPPGSDAGLGDVVARFASDMGTVDTVMAVAIPRAVVPALNALVGTVLLFVLEWRLALVTSLALPVGLVGPRLMAAAARRLGGEQKSAEAEVIGCLQESLAARAAIVAFGLEPRFAARFQQLATSFYAAGTRLGFRSAMLERSAAMGPLLGQLIVVGGGALMVLDGGLSIGSLVAFQALFVGMAASLSQVNEYLPHLARAAASQERLDQVSAEAGPIDAPGAVDLPALTREMAFSGVRFAYPQGPPVLDDVTFTVPQGASVAFVGPSGCGKSTIAHLLARFSDPSSGSVTVDGVDLRQVTARSLRSQLGIVLQETVLLDATVLDNVRAGRPHASDAEVAAALARAGADEVVRRLPDGLATRVGPKGRRLSAGEAQRLAIARALVRDAAVLVLDEATAALDPASEAVVAAALNDLAGRRTLITFTHRLALAAGADMIFMLHGGGIAERGTHAELLAAGGLYAGLWAKQAGFFPGGPGAGAPVEPERLASVPVFSSLDRRRLDRLAELLVTERWPPGREVVREGDEGDRFFILARGQVVVSATQPSGAPREVARLEEGDHFGEMALLDGTRRRATVRTLTHVTLLSLGRDKLLGVLADSPGLRASLEASVRERSRQLVDA